MGARPGTPDLLLLHHGRFYSLELKRDDGRLSLEQRIAREEIEAAGGFWAVAYGVDAALAVLNAWGLLRSMQTGLPAPSPCRQTHDVL